MLSYLAAMVGLGLLALDLTPMVVASAARAAGSRRVTIVAFAVAMVVGNALFGVALTVWAGPTIANLSLLRIADSWEGHAAGIVLGLVFGVWGGYRCWRLWLRRNPDALEDREAAEITDDTAQGPGAAGLLAFGMVDVLLSLTSAPFIAGVVAGAQISVAGVGVGFGAWAAMSESPVALFAVATFLGLDHRLVVLVGGVLERFRPLLRWTAAVVAAVGGVLLVGSSVFSLMW